MTDPEARLAAGTIEAWARGITLVVGFGSPTLAAAVAAHTERSILFEQDLVAFRRVAGLASDRTAAAFGPWIGPASPLLEIAGDAGTGPLDAAVVLLPKATDRLRLLLAMVQPMLSPGGRLALVGHNDLGIRSAPRHLRDLIGDPDVLDYRYHCRAFVARRRAATVPFEAHAWRRTEQTVVAAQRLTICSYPGVFSHGEVDPGTRLLLETVALPADARVLDVGCGSGVIAAWVACTVQEKVHATDVDALALYSSWQTAESTGVADRVLVWGSDVFSDVALRYTHILSNPPFHRGVRTTTQMVRRLIADAPEHLEPAGELWLVANRFLDHGPALGDAFGHVEVAAEDGRYRVWRARR